MTKADALKLPTRRETVLLKVYMHCEQCQKQVKKVLKKLDGVESIAIDADIGKVTVVGTVAASTLVKKLAKAGKYAAPWSNAGFNATFPRDKNLVKDHFIKANLLDFDSFIAGNAIKNADFPKVSNVNEPGESSNYVNYKLSSELGGGNEFINKKAKGGKKVSFGGGGPHAAAALLAVNSDQYSNAAVASKTLSVENSYKSMESVEFATHMFSDENANNCSLM